MNEKMDIKDVEIYYLREEYILMMLETDKITKERMKETHIKMPTPKLDIQMENKLDLEEIFTIFNGESQFPNQEFIRKERIHTSMSTGDIVKLHEVLYVCEDMGWREL